LSDLKFALVDFTVYDASNQNKPRMSSQAHHM